MRCIQVGHGNLELVKLLLLGYVLHKMGYHAWCCDETIGMRSLGNAKCTQQQQQQLRTRDEIRRRIATCTTPDIRVQQLKELGKQVTIPHCSDATLTILIDFLSTDKVMALIEKITPNIHTSINKFFHNVFGIYRDKTKHYKYYNTQYQIAYLDINENRGRKAKWKYSTQIREWKKNHKKRYNSTGKNKGDFQATFFSEAL